jgi:outer membrane immunogenic protein
MNRFAIALLAGVAGVSVMSSAFAADLIIDEPAPAVGIVDTTGNWDGLFIGAFAGAGWGTVTDENGEFSGVADTDYDLSGWQLGVTAGANFTISEAIVAGIVGDIAWSDISGDTVDDLAYNVDWVGSIRGRLGFDGGAFLPYVTAGVAFANATATDTLGATIEDTQTHIGWTVGAGVEFAVADNVSLDLLYRYTDYGSKDYVLSTDPTPLSLTSHAITAGVNFKF